MARPRKILTRRLAGLMSVWLATLPVAATGTSALAPALTRASAPIAPITMAVPLAAGLGTVCSIGAVGCIVPPQPIGSRCFCGATAGTIVG